MANQNEQIINYGKIFRKEVVEKISHPTPTKMHRELAKHFAAGYSTADGEAGKKAVELNLLWEKCQSINDYTELERLYDKIKGDFSKKEIIGGKIDRYA